MHKPIILIGVGEMGGVFARGFLRLGYPVYPLTRQMNLSETARALADVQLVLVAVGEHDLQPLLSTIPSSWRDKLCLLQNELLPNDWQGIDDPTVISVWFEKKPGMEAKEIMPSPVYGPQSDLICDALTTQGMHTRILQSPEKLLFELALKNVYILTSNIAGLRTGGAVGALWQKYQTFARDLATEVIQVQEALTGSSLDADALIEGMVNAFKGDPAHQCRGRNAPARLNRALTHADHFGLSVPIMREVQAKQSAN